jgi:hypothetical protein
MIMFKQKNKIKLASTIGLVLLMSSGISNAALVTNGDFSSGGLGWTLAGSSVNNYFTVVDGPAAAYFWANGETPGSASISQTLVTNQLHNYNLSFYLDMAGIPGLQSFNVEWNGQNLFASDLVSNNNPFNPLLNNSYSFYGLTAGSGTSTTLKFSGINLADYNYLTDVVVTQVPEPESLAMMLLGLPMIAWTARRRKR